MRDENIKPEIGQWWTGCCESDLEQIETSEDIMKVIDYATNGPFVGCWATRDEAIEALRKLGLLIEQEQP